MISIDVESVMLFHKKLIDKTGGSHGVRDLNLIESALNKAFATFDGKDLYETTLDKIVVTTVGLVKNHGFVDGNKRIGMAVMLLLLDLNNIKISYSQQELIDLGLGIASSKVFEEQVKYWVLNHKESKA